MIELAIEHRYEVPSYTLLSKIITDAMNKQRGDIFGKLKLFSHNEELQALQRVLEVDETLQEDTYFQNLKNYLTL